MLETRGFPSLSHGRFGFCLKFLLKGLAWALASADVSFDMSAKI